MARPRREFTDKEIEQIRTLARCHCPDYEIAAYIGCGENTIKRHFGPLIKSAREEGKANLRAMQYRLAMKGDKTMLIWLGKQLLNQRDNLQLSPTNDPTNAKLKATQEKILHIVKELTKWRTTESSELPSALSSPLSQ